jgi:DNA polymerase III subunit epsilon
MQRSLTDLGTPLLEVTFVVVDLETTGGSFTSSRVTEVGAVKVRAGEVLGELQTLVDPGVAIPASISALTGITPGMVAGRPTLEAVLPAFLEFCRGATLVAHNARFDVGFLNAGLARLDYPRLDHPVVCTAALARRLVRDEVRNCKLATLASHFRARTAPVHRALADARATVDVFHGLLERAGTFGVVTLEDLVGFSKIRNTPLFKARRHLADGLPAEPGVYAFRAASGETLYVGKATDLRARVRSYFGADDRRMITDLLKEAARVDHWVCPIPLEAEVRELRLIHEHRPRCNRRAKLPGKAVWLRLTDERYPRLSIVRRPPPPEAAALGPLPSRRVAEAIADALHETLPLRRCTPRIGAKTAFAACALAEMGRCLSPCDGSTTVEAYGVIATAVGMVLRGGSGTVITNLLERIAELSRDARYEQAAALRDRLETLVTAVARSRRVTTLSAVNRLVASRPVRGGRRELALVAGGRLLATATCTGPETAGRAEGLWFGAGVVAPTGPAETAAETDLVARWLLAPGVVVHRCDGTLAEPVAGGRELAAAAARLAAAKRGTGRADSELAAKRSRGTRRPATLPA